jgi:hypothetical protein
MSETLNSYFFSFTFTYVERVGFSDRGFRESYGMTEEGTAREEIMARNLRDAVDKLRAEVPTLALVETVERNGSKARFVNLEF